MTVQARSGRSTGAVLADALHDRLPGLADAMDEECAAEQVERLLLRRDIRVAGLSVGTVWFRDDGTCTLRYRLRLSHGPLPAAEHSVLAKVHDDAATAAAYVADGASAAEGVSGVLGGAPPPYPWRASTAVAVDAALTLHRFPVDPSLPSLARAMDPAVVRSVLRTCSDARGPVDVEVVHHPREGSCVLRYTVAEEGAAGSAPDLRTFYGKVYGDTHGEVVVGFLRALADDPARDGQSSGARFPAPVVYAPSLRLLVTEALPGAPEVPRLLSAALATPSEDVPDGPRTALRAAVRASGRALAALHGCDLPTAPVHPASAELESLRRDLEVVAPVWPDVAGRVRRRVDVLAGRCPEAPELVLSHGDFTPSQVLFGAGKSGVVDLDTVCWADAALDLGRYLAHLELRVAKLCGDAAGPLTDELTRDFLLGYHQATARGPMGPVSSDRVAFYRGTSLARSVLHACRQLKDSRLDLAMSLLDSAPT